MWWKIKLEHHRSCKIEKNEQKPKLGQKRKKEEPAKGSKKGKKEVKNNTIYYDTTI